MGKRTWEVKHFKVDWNRINTTEHERLYLACDNYFTQGNDYGNIQYISSKHSNKSFSFPNTQREEIGNFILKCVIKTCMSSQKDIRHQHNQRQIKVEKGIWACWEELLTQWQGNKETVHSKTKSECFWKILLPYGLRPPIYIEEILQTRRGSKWNEILMEMFIWR